jgi:hypothetical protein
LGGDRTSSAEVDARPKKEIWLAGVSTSDKLAAHSGKKLIDSPFIETDKIYIGALGDLLLAASKKVETILNPAGFIEQSYVGYQSEKSVTEGIDTLEKLTNKLLKQGKPVLILIDITKLGGTSAKARLAGVSGMRKVSYIRAAMYGPLSSQVLVNTLALIAGTQDKTKAFSNRTDAISWLKSQDEGS